MKSDKIHKAASLMQYGFSHARTAFKYGLKSYDFKSGDEILIPEFICDVLIYPLLQLDLNPIFYKVEKNLTPNWVDIKGRVTKKTVGVVMVHYFGIAQDIKAFQEFCSLNSIILIEDNAHGFGGIYQNKLLGTFGEIGLTSPRKTYDIFNGAYLFLRDKKINISHLRQQPRLKLIRQSKDILTKFIEYLPCLNEVINPYPIYFSQEEFEERQINDWVIDSESHSFMASQNFSVDQRKRLELYKIWHLWSKKNGLEPVYGTPHLGCSPQLFPAYTKSHEESKNWFKWGQINHIRISSWPRLPRQVIYQESSAIKIWEKLICFPIDLKMSTKILESRLHNLCGPKEI